MRHIAEMSEHEMVALFLKTEIESPRWGSDIVRLLERDDIAREVVDYPDITNSNENEYRLRLMGEFRGYQRNEGLFEGHMRLTAYALVPEGLPKELPVVLGTSPELTRWDLY